MLFILVCWLPSQATFSHFIAWDRGKTVAAFVCKHSLLHTAFVLWLVWDGGRCVMFLYKRISGGEDHKASKRWMRALVAVMVAAFHLLRLERFSGLVMQISSHEEATELFVIFLHVCIYTPAQIRGRWQWPGAVQQWQGQVGSGQERPAELSLLLFHKVTRRQTSW